MTDFVSQPVGSIPPIPNALDSSELDAAILTDPVKIKAYRDSIAGQLNAQSAGPQFLDLADRIAGIKIETSAQGAAILVLSLIDPYWFIPMSGFIQVDEFGFLWPPIDVTFPSGTDCVWRLCQYHAVWDQDLTAPNLTLTFEDRIVSLLREMSPASNGGLSQGQPNETLGGFFKELVDNANQNLRPSPQIRLVELISPQDPNYTAPINSLPSSTQAPLGQQPARSNPLKIKHGFSSAQQKQIAYSDLLIAKMFGVEPGAANAHNAEPMSLAQLEQQAAPITLQSVQGHA